MACAIRARVLALRSACQPVYCSTPARHISASTPAAGMEEFFGPDQLAKNAVPAGRAWRASELRQKSFSDLQKLWFVCLKERNMLLTERLYYRQTNMAQPDGVRLKKVKQTMARIKVVLGERERAFATMRQAAGEDYPAQAPAYDSEVTLVKKFGRAALVPVDHDWARRPTRADRRTTARKIRQYKRWAAGRAATAARAGEVPDEAREYAGRKAGTPLLVDSAMEAALNAADAHSRQPGKSEQAAGMTGSMFGPGSGAPPGATSDQTGERS